MIKNKTKICLFTHSVKCHVWMVHIINIYANQVTYSIFNTYCMYGDGAITNLYQCMQ